MTSEELGVLCICSERYALGRRTYMPGLVCDIIKEHIDDLEEKDIRTLMRDIENPPTVGFVEDPWGDQCDKDNWMDLLFILNKHLNEKYVAPLKGGSGE